jgi:hypothetical protein
MPTLLVVLIVAGVAPLLAIRDYTHAEHGRVAATAIGPDGLAPADHVAMVAAVQPFVSGGISTTVNLPSTPPSTPSRTSWWTLVVRPEVHDGVPPGLQAHPATRHRHCRSRDVAAPSRHAA